MTHEDMQEMVDQQQREMRAKLRSLRGHKIVAVKYDPKNEGTYTLMLDDKREVSFSASGDDSTITTFEVV